MSNNALIGALILFVVSLLVRVLPAITTLPFSVITVEKIKRILPISVFINLGVYCFFSEFQKHPFAAFICFSMLVLLIILKRINLLVMVGITSFTYFWLSAEFF